MPTTTGVATSFITFSRASTAMRVNASGNLESVASGNARLDYDPVTKSARGLLVEEQRTNLFLYSEQFDNASWGRLNATVSANAAIAPDGTTTADKITGNTGSSVKYFQQLVITAASTVYSWSIFLKAVEYTSAVIYAINAGSPFQFIQATVDLTTGVISGTTSGNGGTLSSATATSYGNGWWRVTLCGTIGAGTSFAARVYPNTIAAFSGDGTSGLLAWGGQLEAGAFTTSYIPTTTASVTRSADVASLATSAFPYSTTEGSLIVSAMPQNLGAVRRAVQLDDGTTNERVTLSTNSTPNGSLTVNDGGVAQAELVAGTPVVNAAIKMAARFKANDFAFSVNGGAVGTDTSGTFPTLNALRIGSGTSSTEPLNGWVRQITYIPRALTNVELQARTA